MEKVVFREFMDKDVVHKTILFADAFNLNIEDWRASSNPRHPYRINFYSGTRIVGYIDAHVNETYSFISIGKDVSKLHSFKSVDTDMPFVLCTPLGMITGTFSTYCKTFKYSIENRPDSFNRIDGLFAVYDWSNGIDKGYLMSSVFTLIGLENERIRVSFNSGESGYNVDISKEDLKGHELVRLYYDYGGGNANIDHIVKPKCKPQQELANIEMWLRGASPFPIDFVFANGQAYTEYVELPNGLSQSEFRGQAETNVLSVINEETQENDPRMVAFLDEVRDNLVLPANGITPVSLYDKMAQLCFSDDEKFCFDFTRAENVETALGRSLIIEKMNNKKKERVHN